MSLRLIRVDDREIKGRSVINFRRVNKQGVYISGWYALQESRSVKDPEDGRKNITEWNDIEIVET